MRVAVVGGVQTTVAALNSLLAHGADVVGVLGYAPSDSSSVSGYEDVAGYARRVGVRHVSTFTRVNDIETVTTLRSWGADVLMVVGLSQMVSAEVRATAPLAIGFHPTWLPKGRGRAPIAWLVLRGEDGAATLFELVDEPDAGVIFAQVPYRVYPRDHAADVTQRCIESLDVAIAEFVRNYKSGKLDPRPQNESDATYWGVRKPEDGLIDWDRSVSDVDALVRATSWPHPGAYAITPAGARIKFMRSYGPARAYYGTPGRVLAVMEDSWIVACRDGAIKLGGFEASREVLAEVRVGDRLT